MGKDLRNELDKTPWIVYEIDYFFACGMKVKATQQQTHVYVLG